MNYQVTPFEELQRLVLEWSSERGILDHSTPQAQLFKAVSEMGELCDAEIKGSDSGRQDAVGDVMVCLINYCARRGFDPVWCLEVVYDVIKDRKGRMVEGGAFVKDEP